MKIVYKYGRHPKYDFDKDERLSKILNGKHGQKGKPDKNHVTGAFDSFLTIWLLTLPEKFREWYNICGIKGSQKKCPATKVMNYNEIALFPRFALGDSSKLLIYPQCKNYDYLPKSWNLMKCFEYYLLQKEFWTTKSIEAEWKNV